MPTCDGGVFLMLRTAPSQASRCVRHCDAARTATDVAYRHIFPVPTSSALRPRLGEVLTSECRNCRLFPASLIPRSDALISWKFSAYQGIYNRDEFAQVCAHRHAQGVCSGHTDSNLRKGPVAGLVQ